VLTYASGMPPPPVRRSDAPRVLLLAGSSEATALAHQLAATGQASVIASFAGRVTKLSLPPGDVRVGGFGGIEGLTEWLRGESIAAVVDATHPFTAVMPWHAEAACRACGIPRLRLLRDEWRAEAGDDWHVVPDVAAAAQELEQRGARRVFLTTGRQELRPFAHLHDTWFLVRAIEPPAPMPLARAEVLLSRGPFDLADERVLMASHGIDALVTKNSGGTAAAPKLLAARELGIPVVMVARPGAPDGDTVSTVEDALAWISRL
jgi:precorrin-6A/cobalt-precorrin-6A reductase